MLYPESPARIPVVGRLKFAPALAAEFIVGPDHVDDGLAELFTRTTDVSCDIETYGLGKDGLRIKSVAFGDSAFAVVLDPRDPYQESLIKKSVNAATQLTFHNSPFDVPNMYANGLMTLDSVSKVTDTLIYSRLANPDERSRKSLDAACARYLETEAGDQIARAFRDLGLSKKDGFRKFDLDRPIYLFGAASDPILTARLLPVVRQAAYDRLTLNHPFGQWGITGDEAWDLVEREQKLNRITLRRTCIGFRVDFEFLDRYRAENSVAIREAEKVLEFHGIRPGVSADLGRLLDEQGQIPADYPRTSKLHAPQMTQQAMASLPYPLVKTFLQHKQVTKVENDYLAKVVDGADANGRIHPGYNWLAATTGRSSMDGQALHQFPGAARGIILADDGDSMASVDLSQIEPVTIANIAGDMSVIEGYESGISDLYTELGVKSGRLPEGTVTADTEKDKKLKAIRGELKTTLLAQLYGEGLPKLSADLRLDIGPFTPAEEWEWIVKEGKVKVGTKVPRYKAAKQLRYMVFNAMPRTEELIVKLKNIGQTHRKIFTVSGRILSVPFAYGRVQTHKAVNYFCQGGAYDIFAEALLEVDRQGLSDSIYLLMHDEMICSESAAHDVQRIMSIAPPRFCALSKRTPVLRTDLKILGERWSDA